MNQEIKFNVIHFHDAPQLTLPAYLARVAEFVKNTYSKNITFETEDGKWAMDSVWYSQFKHARVSYKEVNNKIEEYKKALATLESSKNKLLEYFPGCDREFSIIDEVIKLSNKEENVNGITSLAETSSNLETSI